MKRLGRIWGWVQGVIGVALAVALLPAVWAVWLTTRAVKAAWDICQDSI